MGRHHLWKHADEWNWDALEPRQARTLTAFAKVGIPADDLSLYSLLVQISGLRRPSLLDLAPILEQWQDALDGAFPRQSRRSRP